MKEGCLVESIPAVCRYDDVTRNLTQHMDEMGFGGSDTIAHTLARAGWKVSPRTVGTVRRRSAFLTRNRCCRSGASRPGGRKRHTLDYRK